MKGPRLGSVVPVAHSVGEMRRVDHQAAFQVAVQCGPQVNVVIEIC